MRNFIIPLIILSMICLCFVDNSNLFLLIGLILLGSAAAIDHHFPKSEKANNMIKNIKISSVMDKMPKGKYRGRTIRYIIKTDPEYTDWMLNNMNGVTFTKNIKDYITTWKFITA